MTISALRNPATVAALLLLASFSTRAADRFDDARAVIRQQMLESRLASVAVAVSHRGKIVYEEGFGWADKERRVAAGPHTMYSLASVSKPITVTALMTLVEAGKVSLDQPANELLGNAKLQVWVGDERQLTVRSLITHTSGIPGGGQFFYGDERRLRPDMDTTLLRYGGALFAPGERYDYSNLGYGVLGHIVERASGRSYEQYLKQAIFMPLGMTRTSVEVGPGLAEYQAIRYEAGGQPVPPFVSTEPGSMAVYSSAHDLARLGMFFLKDRLPDQRPILSDAGIAQMLHDPGPEHRDGSRNGGWHARQQGKDVVLGHEGSMAGSNADVSIVPARDICVVVLANGSIGFGRRTISDALFKAIVPEWTAASRRVSAPAVTRFQPPPELVGRWAGTIHTYERELPVELNVLSTGEVQTRIGSQLTTLLNDVRFADGLLTGKSASRIDTADTQRHPHDVSFSLRLRGSVLNGAAMANSLAAPGLSWIYNLPHWVELRRE
ncbi:serine hydrolase domain-containing protein [Steroidobacter sp.]|uniref:serine hydrolase domain-containing protein n=1 Tax=Steroidobacter sp. TaxID=1978227 RepID=UPI001A3D8EC8|nr:serine hydrolase domain-containing protein [Steroidobacter sp.]MBL8268967.1 beta-lactamase family protein [Steroidobacter sp.]